ncbi:hypothetical protein Bca4012_059890 [Brassica carinata]
MSQPMLIRIITSLSELNFVHKQAVMTFCCFTRSSCLPTPLEFHKNLFSLWFLWCSVVSSIGLGNLGCNIKNGAESVIKSHQQSVEVYKFTARGGLSVIVQT